MAGHLAHAVNLAYLASSYPRAVDTAVRNEVSGLRTRGHRLDTFAIRRTPPDQLTSDFHRAEAQSTTYLLSDRAHTFPLVFLWAVLLRPVHFLRAVALAWRTKPPGLRGGFLQLAYLLEGLALARELSRRSIEHLHCHIGENPASVAMLASAVCDVPFSMTIHGPYIFRAPEAWALAEKLRRAAFTACITEFTRSQCMIHLPPDDWGKLAVVRCGPDPAFLREAPPPLPDAPRLVWVGRLCEEKGVPVLLEAFARVVAGRHPQAELVMVGDGPLRPWTEQRLAEMGLGDRVRITGWRNAEEVREEVAAARGLVLPSFAEGLPAVLMEALALGRPVVSTTIAGIPELVEPGRNGWLVPAGSVVALAEAIDALLGASTGTLEAMGRAGRADVLERNNPEREIPRLEALMQGASLPDPAG